MRALKGAGMSDQQVVNFVNGCRSSTCPSHTLVHGLTCTDYPSYELFTETLRSGIFKNKNRKQLRIVIGKDRKVVHSEVI